jgi:Flp pilus assembly pilin Flp
MQRLLPRLGERVAAIMSNRRGATAIEYGLICGLIIVAIVTAMRAVGNNTFSNLFNEVATALT